MPWKDEASRALLLELWMHGRARRRTTQRALGDHLEAAGWIHASVRAAEVTLVDEHRGSVVLMLDRCWSDWRSVARVLQAEELAPTVKGLRELRRRQRRLPPLPERISLRIAASLTGEHSKASLSPEHQAMLGSTEIMRDGAALIRPNAGLRVERAGRQWSAGELATVQGVLAITQRAMRDGTRLVGDLPELVMTVENLAAFVDMPKPDWLMLVHVPGWNVPLAVELLETIGPERIVHFGDLDPNGVRIYELLRTRLGDVELWVPEPWQELLAHAPVLECAWPDGLVGPQHPALVAELARTGRWTEQELVVVDPGLPGAIERLMPRRARAGH